MSTIDAAVMMKAIGNNLPMPSTMYQKAGELIMACRLIPNFKFTGDIEKLIALIEDRERRLLDGDSPAVRSAIAHLRTFSRSPTAGELVGWRND